MAFNKPAHLNGGDFRPYLSYDARAGRMFRPDRMQKGDTWITEKTDITNNCQFLLDPSRTLHGWSKFAEGQMPDKRLVPTTDDIGNPPGGNPVDPRDKYRYYIQCLVRLPAHNGEPEERELGFTAVCAQRTIEALHEDIEKAQEYQDGQVPVIKLVGTTPVKSQRSTNYAPQWKIVGWRDRPEEWPFLSPEDLRADLVASARTNDMVTADVADDESADPLPF